MSEQDQCELIREWREAGATPKLAEKLAALQVTQLRDHRVEPKAADDCDSCQAQIDALNARVTEQDAFVTSHDLEQRVPDLLRTLRANGVTRYKAGDVEIELGPATSDEQFRQEVTDRLHRERRKHCAICGALSNLHYRGSVLLGCDGCHTAGEVPPEDAPPPPPAEAEGAPPVEIDMEETKRLIEEQHRKRAGGRAGG